MIIAHDAAFGRWLLRPLLFKSIVDPDRQQRRTAEVPAVRHGIHLLQQFGRDRQRDLGLVAALPADRFGVGCAGNEAAFGVLVTRLRARFCNGHTASFALACNSSAMANTLRSSSVISSQAFGSRGLISTTARPRPVAFANALRRRIGALIQANWPCSASASTAAVLSLLAPVSAILNTAQARSGGRPLCAND